MARPAHLPHGVVELLLVDNETIYVAISQIEFAWPHFDGTTYLNTSLRLTDGHEPLIYTPIADILSRWQDAQQGNT